MTIPKEKLKDIRRVLKESIEGDRKVLYALQSCFEVARPILVNPMNPYVKLPEKIDEWNRIYGLDIPADLPAKDIFCALKFNIEDYEENLRDTEQILHSLTPDGLNQPVNQLPKLIFTCSGYGLDYSFLALTGIKQNALRKREDRSLSNFERELLEYERKLDEFIRDDYTIDPFSIKRFLGLFKEYLEAYSSERKFKNNLKISLESLIQRRLVALTYYVMHVNTGMSFSDEEYDTFLSVYKNMVRDIPSVNDIEVLEFLCERFYKFYFASKSDTAPALEDESVAFDEEPETVRQVTEKIFKQALARVHESKEEVSKEEKPVVKKVVLESSMKDEIDDYIRNGVVAKECDLEVFKELLARARISDEKKEEYELQMRNLINRNAKARLDEEIDAKRRELLSSEELGLYRLARTDKATISTAKDIDAIVEMTLGELGEDDLELLKGELEPCFEYLRCMFEVEEEKEEPHIAYFTETVGREEVPKILVSLLKNKKDDYKAAHTGLSKLLSGLTNGDREVQGNNLPCRIYAKGRDYKIFYTSVGDTVIIIDGIKGEEGFAKACGTARSEEFIAFLTEVREYIAKGGVVKSPKCTAQVMAELEKSKAVNKQK